MEKIEISTEYINLDQLLKYANIVASGGEAKTVIKSGLVKVNGDREERRGRKVYPGDQVLVDGAGLWIVVKTESTP